MTAEAVRLDTCTCREAYRLPDVADHDPDCEGAVPLGWRARTPMFLLAAIEELQAGTRMPERTFIRLAVDRAGRARYGPDWDRSMS